MHCKECHGTALSNGVHSLKEKGKMVINHFTNKIPEEIRMNEKQLLQVMDKCNRCHSSEFAKWKSGGHSASYAAIFLDSVHNKTEQLNFDCLRCHGMFYEGTTADLIHPLDTKGPWMFRVAEKADDPAIPCMTCHQIHTVGEPAQKPDHANPSTIFYSRKDKEDKVSFFDRHEKKHVSSSLLPQLKLVHHDSTVNVSEDDIMKNCIQCHAPNGFHEAGTSDDRTPRGVHEGLIVYLVMNPTAMMQKTVVKIAILLFQTATLM
ncbi:MAG: hypothetical protein HC906_01520 [Bacteroidales bacterium]|nr:hypothetical protein [Bacteroidales bacterium]